jgi:hypothetical protein
MVQHNSAYRGIQVKHGGSLVGLTVMMAVGIGHGVRLILPAVAGWYVQREKELHTATVRISYVLYMQMVGKLATITSQI